MAGSEECGFWWAHHSCFLRAEAVGGCPGDAWLYVLGCVCCSWGMVTACWWNVRVPVRTYACGRETCDV